MLHILWLMVKFILAAAGILLGILLTLLLLLLFCPVRYKVSGEKKEKEWKKAAASGEVSWLFGAFCLQARFQEGRAFLALRIFGIPLDTLKKWKAGRKKQSKKKRRSKKKAEERTEEKTEEKIEEKAEKKRVEDTSSRPSGSGEEQEQKEERPTPIQEESSFHRLLEDLGKKRDGFFHLLKKLVAIPKKILEKLKAVQRAFQDLCSNVSWWRDFFSNSHVREAVFLLRGCTQKLIKHVLPTRIQGEVTFGFSDPSVTGKVLALLGVTLPLHKNRIRLLPLFEGENCLEGWAKARGRIYGVFLLYTAVKIYFNKNIKYAINRWKRKEANYGQ